MTARRRNDLNRGRSRALNVEFWSLVFRSDIIDVDKSVVVTIKSHDFTVLPGHEEQRGSTIALVFGGNRAKNEAVELRVIFSIVDLILG